MKLTGDQRRFELEWLESRVLGAAWLYHP